MKPEITRIHHLALSCNGTENYNKTIEFYRDILGLAVARSWGEGAESAIMLDTGAGMLEIFANATEKFPAGNIRHFAFDVNNTDACVKAVQNAGYEITVPPTNITIPSLPPYEARIAFCIGPVGEEVEFFEVK